MYPFAVFEPLDECRQEVKCSNKRHPDANDRHSTQRAQSGMIGKEQLNCDLNLNPFVYRIVKGI